jgi:hypothetical protein
MMVENVNTIPEFMFKEGAIQYSPWVIGCYYNNMIGPFRVIRAYKEANGKVGWEEASGMGNNEDLFEISSPDWWCSFKNDTEVPT